MKLNLSRRVIKKATECLSLSPFCVQPNQPLLTLTFDDFPRSAWLESKPLLQDYDAKATFYASGSFLRQRDGQIDFFTGDDLAEIDEHGHEIGCHSFYHESCILSRMDRVQESIRRNIETIREIVGTYEPRTFAYPYGHASLRARRALMHVFATCRGVNRERFSCKFDRSHIPSVGLEKRQRYRNDWPRIVAEVASQKGWLVIFTHDVSHDPSDYGCTQEELYRIMELARSYGFMVATMSEAFRVIDPAPQSGPVGMLMQ